MASTDGQPAEGTLDGLLNSFFMIIFSEIGDKTFLIAAILAMRHPRIWSLQARSGP
jgi:putative Ca2+/H+ antiporter (TMEM165/GDT1 family)